jgi:predicted DNA-binding transcriptional regulator YafY
VVAAARLKVLAALPTELRARASRLVERFHLDAAGWFHAAESVPHLAALADAVWESRRIQVAYRRGSSQVERRIEPLGLVLKAGIWYVVAATDGQVRTYRARRIVAVRDTGETFVRPVEFDLPAHWNESIAAYERDMPRVEITVRVDRRAIGLLADMVGERAVRDAEALDEAEEGWRRLRLTVDWPEEVPGRMLALGGAVEIIDPPEIRERAIATARDLIARHEVS